MQDTLKIMQEAFRLAQETQKSDRLSDTVQLAIVAGIVAIATLVIKGFIDAKAKKAETIAAAEAAKVSQKLAEVEIKIDGRLTQLLEMSKKEAEERGHRLGKEQEQARHAADTSTAAGLPDAAKLKITGGEIKITSEAKKKG